MPTSDLPLPMLGIDPGQVKSGFVVFDGERVLQSRIWPNTEVLTLIRNRGLGFQSLAIEMMQSQGMVVGQTTMETLVWVGRFAEAWDSRYSPEFDAAQLVYRSKVKHHLCGNTRAKDANVRQALIDLLGEPGTKKSPGPTYGVSSHMWSALGVAVTALGIVKIER